MDSLLTTIKYLTNKVPRRVLDIGARNCHIARQFKEAGADYVMAIDSHQPPDDINLQDIDFQQTKFEDLQTKKCFDLVIARLVSHGVSYQPPEFIDELLNITKHDGLIYVTFFGNEDEWAPKPIIKAITLTNAQSIISDKKLHILHQSEIKWHGPTYEGAMKNWHILAFLLSRNKTIT